MDNTLVALRKLYVALGGTASDVANLVIIPDLINAIATQAAAVATAAAVKELPTTPSANGTYNLQCVKNNSGATLSWETQGE